MKREPVLVDGWLYYNLKVNPEPWAIGPVQVTKKGGRHIPFVGRNNQLRTYQDAIREQLAEWNTLLMPGFYWSRHYFWRSRDAYEATASGKRVRKHEVDLTNMVKAAEDAAQEILYVNDVKCVGQVNFVMAEAADIEYRVVMAVHPVMTYPRVEEVLPPQVIKEFGLDKL